MYISHIFVILFCEAERERERERSERSESIIFYLFLLPRLQKEIEVDILIVKRDFSERTLQHTI